MEASRAAKTRAGWPASCGMSDDLGAMLCAADGAVCTSCHVSELSLVEERADRFDLRRVGWAAFVGVQTLLPGCWGVLLV